MHALMLGVHDPSNASDRDSTSFRNPELATGMRPERIVIAQDAHDLVPQGEDAGGFGSREGDHDLPEPAQLGPGISQRHEAQGG
jgi:hypothetical protein